MSLEISSPLLFKDFSGSKVLVSNASKILSESTILSSELNQLSGVGANIQAQLNSKQRLPYVTGGLTATGNTHILIGSIPFPGTTLSSFEGALSIRSSEMGNEGGEVRFAIDFRRDANSFPTGSIVAGYSATGCKVNPDDLIALTTNAATDSNLIVNIYLKLDAVPQWEFYSISIESSDYATSGMYTPITSGNIVSGLPTATWSTTSASRLAGTGNRLSQVDSTGQFSASILASDVVMKNPTATQTILDQALVCEGGYRSTGYSATGLSGPGIEMHYDGSKGRLLSFDRTLSQRIPLTIDGSPIYFYANGVLKASFNASGVFNLDSLTGSRVVVTDSTKNLISSPVTSTELGFLSGVGSNLQTQIDGAVKKVASRITDDVNLATDNLITDIAAGVLNNPGASISYLLNFRNNAVPSSYQGQLSITAGTSPKLAIRNNYNSSWSAWKYALMDADNLDLVAIEALTGTSGFLKKTAANTWTLDTSSYLTTSGKAADSEYFDGIDSSRFVYGNTSAATSNLGAGVTFGSIVKSGFYDSTTASDSPSANTWTHILNGSHSFNPASWGWQLAANFINSNTENYFLRTKANGTWQPWRTIWTSKDFSNTDLVNWDSAFANSHSHNQSLDTTNSPTFAGLVLNGSLSFGNPSNGNFRGVQGTMGVNDQWRIMGRADSDNAGYLEIATSDDGNEPIYVRQYNAGTFGTIVHELVLMDSNGDSIFPGAISANSVSAYNVNPVHCSISQNLTATHAAFNIMEYPVFDVNTSSLSGYSLQIINNSTDSNYTLPTPSAGLTIKVVVRTSGANGHRIYPAASNQIVFSGMYNTSYKTYVAYPSGTQAGVACLLLPGVYEFIGVSSTEWALSSSPKTYS